MNFIFTACLALVATPAFAGPLIVAHRGASREAPENSLPEASLLSPDAGNY